MSNSAIASVLAPEDEKYLMDLWDKVVDECGFEGDYHTKYPHISYHVAQNYSSTRLSKRLETISYKFEPFEVDTTGVGVFTGHKPVVYLPIARSHNLQDIHSRVWKHGESDGEGCVDLYEHDRWIPHITVASGEMVEGNIGQIVETVVDSTSDWSFTVDNIALLHATDSGLELNSQYDLG